MALPDFGGKFDDTFGRTDGQTEMAHQYRALHANANIIKLLYGSPHCRPPNRSTVVELLSSRSRNRSIVAKRCAIYKSTHLHLPRPFRELPES